MTLRDRIIRTLPRETSGSTSHNRFAYQADWALCHLLELHETGRDYVIVFDFHDDVVVLDSAVSPTRVVFYQIKTKTRGQWSRANFTKREENRLPSIIGKMYGNFLKFETDTDGLCFVSNAMFNVRRQADARAEPTEQFAFADLHADEQAAFTAALRAECGAEPNPAGMAHFRCIQSNLSPNGHTDHARGKLMTFLEGVPETDDAPRKKLDAFFRTLKMEILRGSTHEGDIDSFDNLCRHKALDRAKFQAMLDTLRTTVLPPQWADQIRERLNLEQVAFGTVKRIADAAQRFIVDRMDPTNALLEASSKEVLEAVAAHDSPINRLSDTISDLLQSVRNLPSTAILIGRHNDSYIRGMIGVMICEKQELSNPH